MPGRSAKGAAARPHHGRAGAPRTADDRHGAVRGLQLGRRRSRVPWIYSVYHVRMRRPAAAQPDGQWAVGNGQAVPMNPGR